MQCYLPFKNLFFDLYTPNFPHYLHCFSNLDKHYKKSKSKSRLPLNAIFVPLQVERDMHLSQML